MLFSQKRVTLIYGDSIFLTGILEMLRTHGDLSVAALPPQADSSAVIALHPDLILVDALQFTPTQTDQLMEFFPSGHSPPILRLSADSQQLTVLSTQIFPAASIDDLAQALEIISNRYKENE